VRPLKDGDAVLGNGERTLKTLRLDERGGLSVEAEPKCFPRRCGPRASCAGAGSGSTTIAMFFRRLRNRAGIRA